MAFVLSFLDHEQPQPTVSSISHWDVAVSVLIIVLFTSGNVPGRQVVSPLTVQSDDW